MDTQPPVDKAALLEHPEGGNRRVTRSMQKQLQSQLAKILEENALFSGNSSEAVALGTGNLGAQDTRNTAIHSSESADQNIVTEKIPDKGTTLQKKWQRAGITVLQRGGLANSLRTRSMDNRRNPKLSV